jgi:bifunctional DNase/RNase
VAGVSVGAVKVRLYRARQQLREHLMRLHPELQPMSLVQARRQAMIRVHIADVIQQNGKTVVLLLDENRRRVLPIWIGEFEAHSIAMGMRGYTSLRPMTFNFFANMLEAVGAELEEGRVESLRDEAFYGVAKVRIGDQIREVDARPSDVLALAAHTGSPIYVAETVMEIAGKHVQEGIDMPESLMGIEAMPRPSGEGIDAVLEEVEALMSRKSEGC